MGCEAKLRSLAAGVTAVAPLGGCNAPGPVPGLSTGEYAG
jgi:hypothetical protein